MNKNDLFRAEQEWVDLARQGDLEGFNHLVKVNQDRVYAQAFWMMGGAQNAEDLTQETFLTAFSKMHSFRGDSFKAWLLRIVTNLCLDELRRRKRCQIIPLKPLNADGEEIESWDCLADLDGSPEKALKQIELIEAVQRCLDQLPSKHRAVMVLVDLQGLDYAETAAVLRVPIGTVKSRLARGWMRMSGIWLGLNPSPVERLLLCSTSLENTGVR